ADLFPAFFGTRNHTEAEHGKTRKLIHWRAYATWIELWLLGCFKGRSRGTNTGSRAAGFSFRLDCGGLRLGFRHPASVARSADVAHLRRHGDHADARAYSCDDRDDRRDARPAFRWPRAARPRRQWSASGRGMARRSVWQAARAHARVRGDCARDPEA